MDKGATTWALIVAIDEYDEPELRRLKGPVADACEAVGWLRKLGVPDEQILLHAAPGSDSRSDCDQLGLPYLDAKEPTIWKSIARLRNEAGSRLFVFLFGHGLYDPSSKRLFLTQEAGVGGAFVNLGIDEYRDLFMSYDFRDQFLLMDGCLNYPYRDTVRPTVVAAMHTGVTGYTARPQNSLVECFAASQDQRAAEIDGRGAFARRFFAAIDPDNPPPDAMVFDFLTGERRIDARRVMEIVGPQIERDAAHLAGGLIQRPQIFLHGRAGSEAESPLYALTPTDVDTVTVKLNPNAAKAVVRRVRVGIDEDPYWTHMEPGFGGSGVTFPVELVLPSGVRAQADCVLEEQATWLNPERELFRTSGDQVVTLVARPGQPIALNAPTRVRGVEDLMTAGPTTLDFAIKLVDADGKPSYEMTGLHYADVANRTGLADTGSGLLAEPGVRVDLHEDGPEVTVDAGVAVRGVEVVNGIAEAVRQVVPDGTNVRLFAPSSIPMSTLRLEMRGTPETLAGFLSHEMVITIHRPWESDPVESMSAVDVAELPLLPLDPGVATVRVGLPWGSWSAKVLIPPVGSAVAELPELIGTPPLRVGLADLMRTRSPAADSYAMWVLDRAEQPLVREGLTGPEQTPMVRQSGEAPTIWQASASQQGTAVIASLGVSPNWSFPLTDSAAVAVSVASGRPRVEPLSTVPSPEWDLLLSAGRLDALEPDEAVALTDLKWYDYILGLAGGYAVYASGDRDYLDIVTRNLSMLGRTLDVSLLLFAAHRRRETEPSEEVMADLRNAAAIGAVPLLRWGIPLAIDAIQYGDITNTHPRWANAIERIGATLAPTSIWTVWET